MTDDPEAALGAVAAARGFAIFTAERRRGRVGASFLWLRPEPVRMQADPTTGKLVLAAFLPFVMPGGRLGKAIRVWLAGALDPARDGLVCFSRGGHLSVGIAPRDRDWPVAARRLLVLGQALHDMLQERWPDYARAVFAPPLT